MLVVVFDWLSSRWSTKRVGQSIKSLSWSTKNGLWGWWQESGDIRRPSRTTVERGCSDAPWLRFDEFGKRRRKRQATKLNEIDVKVTNEYEEKDGMSRTWWCRRWSGIERDEKRQGRAAIDWSRQTGCSESDETNETSWISGKVGARCFSLPFEHLQHRRDERIVFKERFYLFMVNCSPGKVRSVTKGRRKQRPHGGRQCFDRLHDSETATRKQAESTVIVGI